MSQKNNSVMWYTFASMPVSFPEGDCCCHWCPALGLEYRLDRHYCKCTGEFLLDPKSRRGGLCPLEIHEKEGIDEQANLRDG